MKTNSPRILATLAVATLLCATSGAWAQGGATPSPTAVASASPMMEAKTTAEPMHKGGGGQRGGGGLRLEALTKELDLTTEQQEKIKPILEGQMEKMKAMRADKSGDRGANRTKMMEMREATMKQIEAELTPEQKTKLAALQSKMKERRGGAQRQPGRGEDKAPATAGASATP